MDGWMGWMGWMDCVFGFFDFWSEQREKGEHRLKKIFFFHLNFTALRGGRGVEVGGRGSRFDATGPPPPDLRPGSTNTGASRRFPFLATNQIARNGGGAGLTINSPSHPPGDFLFWTKLSPRG